MEQCWVFEDDKLLIFSSEDSFQEHQSAKAELERLSAESETIILFDYKELLKKYPALSGVSQNKIFDVKLIAYLHDSTMDCSTLEACCKKLCPEAVITSTADYGKYLWQLYKVLVKDGVENFLYNNIELPLAPVLATMEQRGILLDAEKLRQFGEKLSVQIQALETEICTLCGKKFNLNSPKQLGEVLFDELKLTPVGKKTKSGYATDAETLEKLLDSHPAVEKIMLYRKLTKLNSTYVEGLLKYQQADGCLHTSFNMTATATGRLSSTEPNLQNIPAAGELGDEIRKCLIAPADHVFIDADYSQIELRLLAHLAQDPVMLEAFRNDQDIHSITAQQIFDLPAEEITPELRRRAKAVNFGIVYGMSAFALANDLNIEQSEAKEYIKNYFATYPAIKKYLDDSVRRAKDCTYAETMFKRRRPLPELASKNFALRSFGERVALNMPIQGSAADLIKLAMIKVEQNLAAAGLQAGLVLQIHDELVLCAPDSEVEAAGNILRESMESALELTLPLKVSLAVGKNFYDIK